MYSYRRCTALYGSILLQFCTARHRSLLEDYEPPAPRVQGFVSRKKGARSMVEEKKEGKKIIIIIMIIK